MKIESAFEHKKFINAVKKYHLIYGSEIKDIETLRDIGIVIDGLPLPTWKFIVLCNKMELDPRSFITYKL